MAKFPGLVKKIGALEVGESHYFETGPDAYLIQQLQSRVQAINARAPKALKGREFKTCRYTAVSSSIEANAQILVRVERTA